MKTVTREEKLIAQMKNIENIVSGEGVSAEHKVIMITQQMGYLNELVNTIIDPIREEAGDSELIQMVNDTFVEFVRR